MDCSVEQVDGIEVEKIHFDGKIRHREKTAQIALAADSLD